jgi:hypothetical protein
MSMGGGSAPQAQKFNPVDIGQTASLAEKYDELGWSWSDEDLLARFPGLVVRRDANTNDAADQITGPLDPIVQGQFATDALEKAFSSFGGGNSMPDIGSAGSAARGSIASSIADDTLSKQDYDRTYLAQMFADNPERTFGLTGKEATDIAISNALGANNAAYGNYLGQVSQGNADSQLAAQQTQAGIGIALSIIGIAV